MSREIRANGLLSFRAGPIGALELFFLPGRAVGRGKLIAGFFYSVSACYASVFFFSLRRGDWCFFDPMIFMIGSLFESYCGIEAIIKFAFVRRYAGWDLISEWLSSRSFLIQSDERYLRGLICLNIILKYVCCFM